MAPRRNKTSTGRRRIEIRRIEREEARQVCFSKRRVGLFKKASQVAIMCGVEVAAVAFSPGGKAFAFGHPSVGSVLDRFCPSNSPLAQAAVAIGGGAGDLNQALAELTREHEELRARLKAEKGQKEAAVEAFAKARAEGCQAAAWIHTNASQMGEDDLVAFAAALEKMHAAAEARTNQVLEEEALLLGHTVHGGGGEFGLGGMQQQQQQMAIMMAMPPPPMAGFAAGMETVPYQWFGPDGFPHIELEEGDTVVLPDYGGKEVKLAEKEANKDAASYRYKVIKYWDILVSDVHKFKSLQP